MAHNEVGAPPDEIDVECVESLRDEQDYFCGKTYRIAAGMLAKYPDNFRRLGWREQLAEQQESRELKASALLEAAQDEFERARDHQEFMEVQAEVERARAQRQRAEEYRQAAAERAKLAESAQQKAVPVQAPDRAPPAQPEIQEPAVGAKPKTPGPASQVVPRAERLKGGTK